MTKGKKGKSKQTKPTDGKVSDIELKASAQANSDSKLLMSQIDHKITKYFQTISKLCVKSAYLKTSGTDNEDDCNCITKCNGFDEVEVSKQVDSEILPEKKSSVVEIFPGLPTPDGTPTKTANSETKDQLSQEDITLSQESITRHKICTKSPTLNGLRKRPVTQPKTLPDYFPIRRSNRKCKREILDEKHKEMEKAIISGNEDGLEVFNFESKGRGIVATKPFSRGDFVVEYHGEPLDLTAAKEMEETYALDSKYGCYMYYFTFKNKQYCVDATKESGRLGRLINHSKVGNLITKQIAIKDVPHLIFVAAKDIETGEELLYDYGDRSKSSLLWHPWLAS